jgi:hypothetical protein
MPTRGYVAPPVSLLGNYATQGCHIFGIRLIVDRHERAAINWRTFAVLALIIGWGASFFFFGIVYGFDLNHNLFRIFFPALLVFGSLLGFPLRASLRRPPPETEKGSSLINNER